MDIQILDVIDVKGEHVFTQTLPWNKEVNSIKLNKKYEDLLEVANALVIRGQHFAIIEPKPESIKAIKAFVELLIAHAPAEESRFALFGPLLLDKKMGYEGKSVFLDNKTIGFEWEERHLVYTLKEGTDYAALFKGDTVDFMQVINKKSYKSIIKLTIKQHQRNAKNNIDAIQRDFEQQRDKIRDKIKKNSAQYKETKKVLSKIDKIRPTLDPDILPLLERALTEGTATVNSVDIWARDNVFLSKKVSEYKSQIAYLEGERVLTGSDYKAVQGMLKKGYIEEFGYKEKEGIYWTYAPMDYERERGGKKYFLGRIKVTLRKEGGMLFYFLSYDSNKVQAGTLHVKSHKTQQHNCWGSFQETVFALLLAGQISNLIVVIRDYLKSANPLSPYDGGLPDWKPLEIPNPQVIDDSYEVYVKKLEEAKKNEDNKGTKRIVEAKA